MRRDVWYRREDPVVLPRSRSWTIDYRLIAAAIAASALVTGATYAAFYTSPPALAETPSAPIARDWLPSVEVDEANALTALSGPTHAAPDVPAAAAERSEEVFFDEANGAVPLLRDDTPSASENMSTPSAAPTERIPYPNPTTTPPDAVAPPEVPTDAPTPVRAPDNPYQDSSQ